jgi:hypothetical protein
MRCKICFVSNERCRIRQQPPRLAFLAGIARCRRQTIKHDDTQLVIHSASGNSNRHSRPQQRKIRLNSRQTPYSQSTTHLAWRSSNELGHALQSPDKSLPQLPQATMEMRPVLTQLPEMFAGWNRMYGLREVICVESRDCQSWENDGEGV